MRNLAISCVNKESFDTLFEINFSFLLPSPTLESTSL